MGIRKIVINVEKKVWVDVPVWEIGVRVSDGKKEAYSRKLMNDFVVAQMASPIEEITRLVLSQVSEVIEGLDKAGGE